MYPDLKEDPRTYVPLYPTTTEHTSKRRWISRQNIKCFLFFFIGLLAGVSIGAYYANSHAMPSQLHNCIPCADDNKESHTIASAAAAATITGSSIETSYPSESTRISTTKTASTDCSSCLVNVTEFTECPKHNPVIAVHKTTRSLFTPLSKNEFIKISQFLSEKKLGQLPGLTVTHVYLHPPDKNSALQYLDKGGPFPGRYARAHVTRSNHAPPDVMEYKIGPIEGSYSDIKVEKLLADGEIHYNRRPYDYREEKDKIATVRPHLNAMKPMLMESFDGRHFENDLGVMFSTYPSNDLDDGVSSMFLYYKDETGEPTIRVLPVQCLVHHPGDNASLWFASDFYYLNQGPYQSGKELYETYETKPLRKFSLPKGYFDKHRSEYFPRKDTSLPERKGSDIPPPKTYEPEGPRYSVEDQKVDWMGWSFQFTSDLIRGPALYDIRFKGERIAYEISLQDITLLYASGTTGAGMTPPTLSDTEFMLGNAGNVRPGLDCPQRATILNVTTMRGNALPLACLFEADGQEPLWRHMQGAYARGLLNHFLILRCPLNLGNYDYSLQWSFHLDGHLETIVTASGYLFTSFWDAGQTFNGTTAHSPFGFRVGEMAVGSYHDHSFVFKVDLDVIDRNNSFEAIQLNFGNTATALKRSDNKKSRPKTPSYFPFNSTKYLTYKTVVREKSFKVDSSNPEIWTFVNENRKNAWGNKRGYQLLALTSLADVIPIDHPFYSPWSHLKYHCAISKYKPKEMYATQSIYDLNHPNNNVGGIDRMIDNDAIQNEDIVAWVTTKFSHVPTSEDLPMTMGVKRGFVLKPFNFFDSSPVFDLRAHYTKTEPYTYKRCCEQ